MRGASGPGGTNQRSSGGRRVRQHGEQPAEGELLVRTFWSEEPGEQPLLWIPSLKTASSDLPGWRATADGDSPSPPLPTPSHQQVSVYRLGHLHPSGWFSWEQFSFSSPPETCSCHGLIFHTYIFVALKAWKVPDRRTGAVFDAATCADGGFRLSLDNDVPPVMPVYTGQKTSRWI